jgi:hypothetical protein
LLFLLVFEARSSKVEATGEMRDARRSNPATQNQGTIIMTAPFVQSAPQRRSLGTSGVFSMPDPSPAIDEAALAPREAACKNLEMDALRIAATTAVRGDKIRSLAVDALKIARQQAKAACHAVGAIHGDPKLAAADAHRRADAVATAAIFPALEPLEKARRALEKSIEELRAATAGPAGVELSDVQLAEIRSKLSGLPQAQRVAKIARSIEKGSDQLASAVFNCDPFLCDFLTDVEISTLRELWARTRMPDSVTRLAQLESDLGHVDRTGKVLQTFQRSCANQAIVAGGNPPDVVAGTRGAHGPVPVDRSRSTSLVERALAFKQQYG